MGHKNCIQTTLSLVVYFLSFGTEGSVLTKVEAAQLKTALEVVKAKCDAAKDQANQTSATLNAGAIAGLHPPAPVPTGAPDVNIAQGKTAYQTSNYAGYTLPSRSVDGNTNGRWNALSCSCTSAETTPMWWVDLGQTYRVNRVVIYNRWDCCRERLNPFNIHIGDSNQVTLNPKCGGDHQIALNQPSISVSCPGMTGRYVGVRLPGSTRRYLTLCEVQVFSNAVALPKKWREDRRCGAAFPAPGANPGQCDPNSPNPCCSPYNYCGVSRNHCGCHGCVDYRNTLGEKLPP
ncbi:Hypp9240 [Branchiostoma lanceolatum]|uniref:Hypp9240 protein n=1 Tax=Branchiostoma lanceolatum TaxID=7740 RepID=A0A8K0EIG1_BRALA|nr:Hypp9240 [Branchiostoma lanceolatum]